MPDPTPHEAAEWFNANPALWIANTDEGMRAMAVLLGHARATTPGDDRGRELAEVLYDTLRKHPESAGFAGVNVRHLADACAARLRALAAPSSPGITREAVIEAVRWVVPVPTALRDKPGAAEAVADRLGLTEEAGQ